MAPRTLSCIIYDLDGTLIDSVDDIAYAVNRLRTSYGLNELSSPHVAAFVGDGAPKLLERAVYGRVEDKSLRPTQILPSMGADPEEVLSQFLSIYAEDPCVHSKLYPGVRDALRHWAAEGTAQAILTNKPHPIAERVVEELQLSDVIDVVCGRGCRDDDGGILPPKPDTAAIDWILDQTGAERDETCVVGDGIPDVEVARAASIPCIVHLGGYTTPDKLVAAADNLDLVATSFAQVQELLLGMTE